jgi:hypothetical protein
LARVLLAAVGPAAKQAPQKAEVETGVETTPRHTQETLTIRLGQRTVSMIRAEIHEPITAVIVDVEECLWKPGMTPKKY